LWNVSDSSTIGLNPGNDPYRGHISSTMIRLCPDPNTCTIRPARIAPPNHSAAWRTAGQLPLDRFEQTRHF
jgi:hypothetical protein